MLPNYFKKIAIAIILLVIAFEIISKVYNLRFSATFAKVSIILAGYIFITAREKIEDEFIKSTRLRACAYAFLTGIIAYIINEIFFQSTREQDAFPYFFKMIFMYIFLFYLTKYGVITFGKQSKGNKGEE